MCRYCCGKPHTACSCCRRSALTRTPVTLRPPLRLWCTPLGPINCGTTASRQPAFEWQRDYARWLRFWRSPYTGPVENADFLEGGAFSLLTGLCGTIDSADDHCRDATAPGGRGQDSRPSGGCGQQTGLSVCRILDSILDNWPCKVSQQALAMIVGACLMALKHIWTISRKWYGMGIRLQLRSQGKSFAPR